MSTKSSSSDIPVCVECGTEEEEILVNKKECTACKQINLDDGASCQELLNGMSIDVSGIISACANCGKGEEAGVNLKSCTACKLVKYCGRDCQIAQRPA